MMFYIVKKDTLNKLVKTFVGGGYGLDYEDPNQTTRNITNEIGRALKFDSVAIAKRYLCEGYVVACFDKDCLIEVK